MTAEIRSVNGRYLDLQVKLPRTLQSLEPKVRALVSENPVARGRVDVCVTVSSTAEEARTEPNFEKAEAYVSLLRKLRDRFSLIDDISVMQVAKNADVFAPAETAVDVDALWAPVREAVSLALKGFVAERAREGASLTCDVRKKIDYMRGEVERIKTFSETDANNALDRARRRISSLLADCGVAPDEGRLLTEAAIWVDRIAIDEEIVRLTTHLDALYAMTETSTPVGKKFEYQLQEASREINTIGSKCQNAEIAQSVVLLKAESEKIREQIQNVE